MQQSFISLAASTCQYFETTPPPPPPAAPRLQEVARRVSQRRLLLYDMSGLSAQSRLLCNLPSSPANARSTYATSCRDRWMMGSSSCLLLSAFALGALLTALFWPSASTPTCRTCSRGLCLQIRTSCSSRSVLSLWADAPTHMSAAVHQCGWLWRCDGITLYFVLGALQRAL